MISGNCWSLWGFIRHRQICCELINLTNVNIQEQLFNASDAELKQLCSGVLMSFSPKVTIKDLNRVFTQNTYRPKLKHPSPEITSFVNSYWVTMKFTAMDQGVEITSLIFGLPVDVVSEISEYSLRKLATLSSALELRFELRYQSDLIANLIGGNAPGQANLPTIMNRLQQTLKSSGDVK